MGCMGKSFKRLGFEVMQRRPYLNVDKRNVVLLFHFKADMLRSKLPSFHDHLIRLGSSC